VPDARADAGRVGAHVAAGDGRRAAGRGQQPGQHPDRRRLARPIRAEQRQDRPLRHPQREPVDGDDLAEAARQVRGLDHAPAGATDLTWWERAAWNAVGMLDHWASSSFALRLSNDAPTQRRGRIERG
jgi:hypothetical protein